MLLILIFTLIKHNFVVSWESDYLGTVLLCIGAIISNPIQMLRAYKEIKKTV